MKFANSEDNKYMVKFMRATEAMLDSMAVQEFVEYLENNAEFEDEDTMYLDGRIISGKIWMLHETDNLRKEFFVSETGRLFYLVSLLTKCELIDKKETAGAEVVKTLVKEFNDYSELVALNYAKMREGDCDEGTFQWNRGNLNRIEDHLKMLAKVFGVELVWECREHTFGFDDWKRKLEYRTVSAVM